MNPQFSEADAAHGALYTVGGTVQASGGHYLSRGADDMLLASCQRGEFAYILTARQMGKSSLMLRTAERLAENGVRTVQIDLTLIGTQVNAVQWYFGLLYEIRKQLQLPVSLTAWWAEHDTLGPTQRFTHFCTEVVLAHVACRVVIFVDEIDTTLGLSFTDDFYAAIRGLYLDRGQKPVLQRLSFVLIGVATPSDLVRDPRRTPFNIGQRIELTDFTLEEGTALAAGLHPIPQQAHALLIEVFAWTGGHPYLTQRLCQAISAYTPVLSSRTEVASVVRKLFFDEQVEQDHNLQFVRDMLTRRAPDVVGVLSTYQAVRQGRPPVLDDEQSQIKAHLKLSGVVRRTRTTLVVRNRIYGVVFNAAWVREHLPVHWSRALRRALRAIAVLVALTLSIGGLAFYALVQRAEAVQQRGVAEAQARTAVAAQATSEARRVEAEEQRQVARSRELAALGLSQAERDSERAILLAREAKQIWPTDQAEAALRTLLTTAPLRQVVQAHQGEVRQVALSPTGLLLGSTGADGKIRLWDSVALTEQRVLHGHQGPVVSLTFSQNGERLVSAGFDGTVRLWEVATGHPQGVINLGGGPPQDIRIRDDGAQLLTLSAMGAAQLWWLPNGAPVAVLGEHTVPVTSVAYSPDGASVVTGGGDGIARVWDSETGALGLILDEHVSQVTSVSFNNTSTEILTTSTDGTARLWDRSSGAVLHALLGHTDAIFRGLFAAEGQVITASRDGSVRVWDAARGSLRQVRVLGTPLIQIELGLQGTRLLVRGTDQLVVWDLPNGQMRATLPDNDHRVTTAVFNTMATVVVTGGNDGVLRRWDVVAWPGELRLPLGSIDPNRKCVGFSPDGQMFFIVDDQGTRIWEAASGEPRLFIPTQSPPSRHSCIGFSRDSSRVALSNGDTQAVIDLRDGRTLLSVTGPVAEQIVFSPSEKQLVIARVNGTIDVLDADTGQRLRQLLGHETRVFSLSFDRNGNLLTDSNDGTARVWSLETGKQLSVYGLGFQTCYNAVAHLDERHLVTGYSDGTVRVWQADDLKAPLLTLRGHTTCLDYADLIGSQYILTSGEDGTAAIWDLRTGEQFIRLENLLPSPGSALASPDGKLIALLDKHGWRLLRWEQIAPRDELDVMTRARVVRSLTCAERRQYLQDNACSSGQ